MLQVVSGGGCLIDVLETGETGFGAAGFVDGLGGVPAVLAPFWVFGEAPEVEVGFDDFGAWEKEFFLVVQPYISPKK